MVYAVYCPFLLSAVFALIAAPVARQLPPGVATWLLSVGGVVAAAGPAVSLSLLGFTLAAQNPLLAEPGGWSTTLREVNPVARPVAASALTVLAVLAVRFVIVAFRRGTALRDAFRLAAALPAAAGELAVIDDPSMQAYTVPGRPGRIVISSGLLRNLGPAERRAVLAHERTHLRHRHHLHLALAHLAAGANPLLIRLPAAVALSTERWADESAAAACPRDTVANALAQVSAGAQNSFAPPVGVLGVATTEILSRVDALHSPAPRLAGWRVATILAILVAITAAVIEAVRDTNQLFEVAQAAYRAAHR